MPTMTPLRLGDLNLIYKIIDTMESNGFVNGRYQVIDGFPNELDLENTHIWPTISVEVEGMFGRSIELGSNQWPGCQVAIDVFAKTDSQRDDIGYILWKELNEGSFTLYDFNTGFPSTAGGVNYTGITVIGDWGMDQMSIFHLSSPPDTNVDGEKHHSVLDGVLLLPNI